MKSVIINPISEISRDSLAYLLCSGMEGGISYWAEVVGYEHPEPYDLRDYFSDEWSSKLYKHIHFPLLPGGAVILRDKEEDKHYKLDLESLLNGMRILANKYPSHYANFLNDDFDAFTGDVFIQCAVLGDIIYG